MWSPMTIALVLVANVLAALWFLIVILTPSTPSIVESEELYRTASAQDKPKKLRSVHDDAAVYLSVVVPAYNERKRLGIMLRDAVDYLETLDCPVKQQSYEILIVDDGSKDGTADHALELAEELEREWSKGRKMRGQVKVVTMARNRGKGAAVRHGVLHSSGERILFADADGASHFPHVKLLLDTADKLMAASKTEHALVVGSRAHLVRTEAVVKRSVLRNLLMRGFHSYLWIMGIRHVKDTQCGFKLCTRSSARIIYQACHSPSWIFDCELILLAELAKIPTAEVGIDWHEVAGSKIDLVKDSIKMALDLLVIRGNYALGNWDKPSKVMK